jgi:hypothetical protein
VTIISQWVICPKCKKKYSWNLDVGRIRCPSCGTITAPFGKRIARRKRKFYLGGIF